MELHDFVKKIAEDLKIHYGEGAKVETHQIYKNNGVLLQGICVLPDGKNIAPTVYLNQFFNELENGKEFGEIFNAIIQLIEKNQLRKSLNVDFFMEYEKLKKHLVYRIINKERNKRLLKKVPYKELEDLAVVCHCLIEEDEIGTGSILIYHHHLKNWDITEEELFRDAADNSPVLEPCQIHKMSTLVKEILSKSLEERVDEICQEYPQDKEALMESTLNNMVKEMDEGQISMYVLTNSRRYYGAASLAYEDIMEDIAKLFNNDYYILPSSVHELILLEKTEDVNPGVLNEMIQDVNRTQVDEEEWLGDHAYLYHRNSRQLEIV